MLVSKRSQTQYTGVYTALCKNQNNEDWHRAVVTRAGDGWQSVSGVTREDLVAYPFYVLISMFLLLHVMV